MITFREFLDFTFQSFWSFSGICIILYIVINPVLNTLYNIISHPWNRLMRMLMVRKHGWPPNPKMDADGDIVYEKNSVTNNEK